MKIKMKIKLLTKMISIFVLINTISTLKVFAAQEPLQPIQEVFEPPVNPDERIYSKVAVIQWAPPVAPLNLTPQAAEQVKQNNRLALTQLIIQAAQKKAKWIISSEMGVVGYPYHPGTPDEEENFFTREEVLPYAEMVPGPSTQYFGNLAKQLNVHIQFGFVEIEQSTQRLYNTAVLVDPNGSVVLTHRKRTLFHIESNYFTPGTDANVYNSLIGPIGILICADVYDSSLLRDYRRQGVRVLNLSTSWANMNSGMDFFRRAAVTVKSYLLAANQPYFPDSGVVNPDGTNQSHIRQSNGIAYGYVPYARPLK